MPREFRVYAAVEAAGDGQQGSTAMVVIIVGQNVGMLLGPLILGTLVETAGWPGKGALTGAEKASAAQEESAFANWQARTL